MGYTQVFVVAHKPFDFLREKVYAPIHVGRSVSRFKDEMSNMIGDDTGENISEKNPQYCEMTAHYWIWKNVHNTKYVGISTIGGILALIFLRRISSS